MSELQVIISSSGDGGHIRRALEEIDRAMASELERAARNARRRTERKR